MYNSGYVTIHVLLMEMESHKVVDRSDKSGRLHSAK